MRMTSRGKDFPRRRDPVPRLFAMTILLVLAMGIAVGFNDRGTAVASAPAQTRIPTRVPTASALAALSPTPPLPTATVLPSMTATLPPTLTPFPTATATEAPSATPTLTPAPSATPNWTLLSDDAPPPPAWTPTGTPLPLPTPQGIISYTLKVPILMYHYISSPPGDADRYRVDLSVEPAVFRQQMQYLADNGFTPIDFYALSRAIAGQEELPLKPVIITIDDGYLDAYTEAFPILREFGFTATVFVITEFIDHNYPQYVSWDMVIEMADAGIRIEPHTKTHIDLRERDRATLIYQLLGSLQSVEARIGYRPRFFAYPAGRYDEAVIDIVRELDFWGAVTTQGGKWHGFNNRYEWERLRVRYNTPLAEFIDLVTPGDARYGKAPGMAPTATPGP